MNEKEPPATTPFSISPLVVEFAVFDWRKSLDFYTDLLGFKVVYDRRDEGFVFLRLGGAQVMFYQANLERNLVTDAASLKPPLGQGMNLQIQGEAVEPLIRALTQARVALTLAPEERWYRMGNMSLGVRQFAVADPDGYLLRFSQCIGSRAVNP